MIIQPNINENFMFIKKYSGQKITMVALKPKNSGLKDSAICKRFLTLKILLN